MGGPGARPRAACPADSRYGDAGWSTIWPDDPEGRERRIAPVRAAERRPGGPPRSITSLDLAGYAQ
jgi:hypothetical protein